MYDRPAVNTPIRRSFTAGHLTFMKSNFIILLQTCMVLLLLHNLKTEAVGFSAREKHRVVVIAEPGGLHGRCRRELESSSAMSHRDVRSRGLN